MESLPPAELSELRKLIKETKTFTTQKELYDELDSMHKENKDAIEQFRELIVQLTEDLSSISGDRNLATYKSLIISFINNNPKKVIDTFIIEAYNKDDGFYRKQLVTQNEEFFMKNSFEELTGNDKSVVDYLFQFKNFWSKLKDENKQIIKYYLLTLCSLSDIRYVNFYKYCELKKKYQNFKALFDAFNADF